MSELASGEAPALVPSAPSERAVAAATAAVAVGVLTLITAGALFVSGTAIGLRLFGAPPTVVWAGIAVAAAAAMLVAGRFAHTAWRYERSA